MNLVGILAGSLAERAGSKLLTQFNRNEGRGFMQLIDHITGTDDITNDREVSLSGVDLNQSQINSLLNMRDEGLKQGLDEMVVELNGKSYVMDLHDLKLEDLAEYV
jgi:hypothetical protein